MLKTSFLFVVALAFTTAAQEPDSTKICGVSYVSMNTEFDSSFVRPVLEVGANWVGIIPYCFMTSATQPELHYNHKMQWQGERLDGAREIIQRNHARGLKVMVKPQIWIHHGIYTGKITMNSDEEWQAFEDNYSKYILDFARMAEEEGVAMFCIGTEMGRVVNERPEIFERLIEKVREEFSGKLTYASNWDDYHGVGFWKVLDYIGVDAYFPLAKEAKASVGKLKSGWTPHWRELDSLSDATDVPVLFTEYGYRSSVGCAIRPWDYSNNEETKIDQKEQLRALSALYEVIWDEPNFAGGFLWKWHPKHEQAGGKNNSMFTVQNKMAEEVVRERYSAN